MPTERRGQGERHDCSRCGSGLEASMNFCPTCGAPSRTQTETASSGDTASHASPSTDARRQRLEEKIAMATSDGWELEYDFGDRAVMSRRSVGSLDDHVLIGLLTLWWTMGLGNIFYGIYVYSEKPERMVLHPDAASDPALETETSSSSHILARMTTGTCWLLGTLVLALAIVFLGTAPLFVTGLLLAIAALFGLVGASVLPSVNNRLSRRHSVLTNGRTRSVDERRVDSYTEPCTDCGEPIGHGLERRYRSEFCLLGVPITGSSGTNYYCQRCASAEQPISDSIADQNNRDTTVKTPSAENSETEPALE
ncbi:zinc ribbon domain-containing protein [Natronolimnobius sp. AArcel1]|uniref:zinc ribbon domain-containing protein n=1 Tax=Natronolimnobius sp. AArcel1 TaxID=1679093 RepID=UPI0013EACB41|nr:zinc ribbon domain-containing protein [Natronolimnobius sp. AArcel1]NGM67643.1 zinc ribbon domain-containing protein [Natronolimnobius sp. AArcel1]